jgi:hypothetical protein
VGLEVERAERLRSQSAPNAAEIGDWLAESGIHSNSLLAFLTPKRGDTLSSLRSTAPILNVDFIFRL